MSEPQFYRSLLLFVFAAAGVAFVATGTLTAPYGRHSRSGWGPVLSARAGWLAMESPALLGFAAIFFSGSRSVEIVPRVFFVLWMAHYVHRSLIYPLTVRSKPGRTMPVVIISLGFVFNSANAYLNARSLTALGPSYDLRWLIDVRFLYGALVFVTGFVINRWSDLLLRRLRAPGQGDYKIPHGGLFSWVSCPNYFGELLQWTGWAIATWSPAGAAFAVFTAANLIPRAVSHHRWYRRTFPEYPQYRKAIIPFLL